MDIKLFNSVCERLGSKVLKKFNVDMDQLKWNKYLTLDLNHHSTEEIQGLSKLLKPMMYDKGAKLHEAVATYKDIQIWLKTKKKGGVDKLKARNCYTFFTLAKAFLKNVPGHRIYLKDEDRAVFHCFYVDQIDFNPKQKMAWGERPAHTDISGVYIDFGIFKNRTFPFSDEKCYKKSVEEILIDSNLFVETKELREEYLESKRRFDIISKKIGKQYLATGIATDEVDSDDDDDFWKRTKYIFLSKEGQPSNVVVDVFFETDKKQESQRNASINKTFWLKEGSSDDDDDIDETDLNGQKQDIEIPIHPFLSCFDLRRHMRLKIHVSQLKAYKYDETLGEKLVLPMENRVLIDSLVSANNIFKDVVKGKSGGSVIICTGGPGLGKTLTAEVYSEVVKRPLYSVQCSQLGISAEEIESNLMSIFKRSRRWNAILLLDEADVYIHKRGRDLQQNAIVGVFLRTLEYYNGVMFLTTNRGKIVDDAILSRCIARVDYKIPNLEDQKKIWRIQADNNNIELSDKQIKLIVEQYPLLSGRDIKNLLKLSMMVAISNKTKVTEQTIFLVKKFKPTTDLREE